MVAIGAAIVVIFALLATASLLLGQFTEALAYNAGASGDLFCIHCKSKSVRTSFRAGLRDFLMSMLSCAPYRCEVCYYRFYVRRQAAPGQRAASSVR